MVVRSQEVKGINTFKIVKKIRFFQNTQDFWVERENGTGKWFSYEDIEVFESEILIVLKNGDFIRVLKEDLHNLGKRTFVELNEDIINAKLGFLNYQQIDTNNTQLKINSSAEIFENALQENLKLI